jgi:hypothetical protein
MHRNLWTVVVGVESVAIGSIRGYWQATITFATLNLAFSPRDVFETLVHAGVPRTCSLRETSTQYCTSADASTMLPTIDHSQWCLEQYPPAHP